MVVFLTRSSMDQNICNKGRPFGGIAIILPSEINYKMLHIDKNCIVIETENLETNFTLANVYLPPHDSTKNDDVNLQILAKILGAQS